MRQLRRIVAVLVVFVVCATAVPQAAIATEHAPTAVHRVAPAGPSLPSGRPWWDPFGWFTTGRAEPKPTTFTWSPPKGPAAPSVHIDPNAHRVAELPQQRTANSTVYRLSDGREQEVVSQAPVHYRDARGQWQPIGTSVAPVSHGGGFTLGSEANSFHTYFSSSASSLVRLEQGSGFVQLGVDGAGVGAPRVSGDTVTYPGALGGADLAYQLGAQGVNERIVLNQPPAPGASYAFTLTLGGLTPKQRPDGSIAFYGSESNQAVFVIPAPYMSDAHPDANSPYGVAYSTKVSQRMDWDAKTGVLHVTVTPDAAWLSAKERQYPVAIDPTIVEAPTPTEAANVMILQDSPSTNFDTNWRLSVGTTPTGAARALIKFPAPSVPAGTTITSASLNLYYDQDFTTGANNVALEAHAATAAWDPTQATWDSANGISGALAGSTTKQANVSNVWNSFPVTSTVQGWINGTSPNDGFVVKAADEATLGQGGPRYEASIFAYGGETVNYPQLVITYGVPGVAVNSPTVIHSTGAELSWPTYTNTTGDSGNNIVEYQVHRSVFQTFTPDASTEVAPVASGTTSFVDTTAQPTPTSSTDPYGNAYYYMVVVKTANGALIAGPTQLVRLPKAGLTTVVMRQGAGTTLSSAQPNTVLNTLSDSGLQQPWLEVGDNSSTYGTTRAVFNFGALPATIPANATVMDSYLRLWQFETDTTSPGAVYELHALTRAPTISQATWNNATSTTAWTTPGGDVNSTADGTVSGLTNDPNRQTFDATAIVQGWVTNPASNDGLEVKLADESPTAPQEHTLLAGTNTAEAQLAPALVVTYLDPTTANTYYAPTTPAKTVPGTTYTVPVTINNTTGSTWSAATEKLTYHWTLPDGTDVTNTNNQVQTALPADMAPGSQQTLNAQVTPPTPADTNDKGQYTLSWDMLNTSTGSYLSSAGGIGSLNQAVGVEEPGSNQLGLESFYQYTHTDTGAGSALYTNDASGNTVWNYNAFSNPSRGFATFARMSYNSLDTTDSTTGFGWSVQLSTPTRLGTPLDFHPNPNPTEVTFVDGDGTSHVFTWNATTSTWTAPAGVHLFLQQLASCGPQVTNARAWEMTSPDRTQFFYDCEGFPTAVVDKNGNEADFTYSDRKSENKPEEFLAYITDPAGRRTLNVTYFNKGDNYNYIDSTGNLASGTNLTDPSIIDHVKSITDISGREIDFLYTTQGLLGRMVDGAGISIAKTFNYAYDATQGMKNVKLVQVTDPRGNATHVSYYDPPTDPKFHWWTQNVTDRLNHSTGFAYTEPGTISGAAVKTTVTDANNHAYVYQIDGTGRLMQAVDPLNETTNLAFDADNNVTSLTEANGAVSTWTYDPNTGYPLTQKDAQANHDNKPATTYTYQTSLSGHIADITDKVSAAGRHWHFGYDGNGNLTSVQDPNGTANGSGFTTTYGYDTVGDLLTATDANNHATTYANYDPTGYPDTTTDALNHASTAVYGPRGEVTSVTDALGHTTTQNYDTFLRPLDGKTPKDQAGGVYITTPAPVYDANDNITQKTAPNGAVSTAVYDANDHATSSTLPKDTPSSATRTTSYTYDPVGNRLTVTTPNGNVSGAPPGSYTTTTGYDAMNQPTTVTDAANNTTTTGYDNVGNKTSVKDPLNHTTQTAYDLDHRPTTVTDPLNHTTTTGYDPDGAKISATDQNGNITLITNDPDGHPTQIQVPHTSSGGTISYDTTQYTYDQVGNQTAIISPRGVASGITGAYTTKTSYDADNRKSAEFGAFNPNDPIYNTAPETDYTYDPAGRLTQVSAPASGGSTVRAVTNTTYFDNGWTKTSTDPWSITTAYDYNELGKQTSRTLTSAGGSSARTQSWAYYPDGTLQTRSDHGVPAGLQVEMVDNSDVQNVTSTGTWTAASSGTGFQGYNYQTHAAGAGTDSLTWNLTIPEDGTYQVYVQYPQVSGAATNAQYTVNHTGGQATQTVNQTTNSGTWVSLGSYAFTQAGTGQSISLAQNPGGVVTADAIKVVRDNSGDTQPGPVSFTYSYDPDGNTTDLTDNSPNAQFNDYALTYDGLDRLTQLQEKLSGTVKHTTGFTYDNAGNPQSETHDASSAAYTFDERNLLTQVVNKETATDPGKTTSYTYTPSKKVATQTKGNGNVATFTYNLDDSIATSVEKTSGGTVVAQHTLTYDPNGNTTQDASVTQNADNSAATLNRTATNTYTPSDKIQTVTNSDGNDNQSYTYDLAGNITAATIGGGTANAVYDRNRLLTVTQNGTTADYNYDPFGRSDTVTAGGTVTRRYTYDGFDHIASEAKNPGTGLVTTDYAYDPFDRRVSQTESAGTPSAKTTNFDYLATSKALVDETVGGAVTKTYQYAPSGERLDQVVHNTDGSEDPTYYTYNAHTDVQAITDATGNTKATYGYTAYGADDVSQDTGVDKNTGNGATGTTTSNPYNVYRFNAKRIDNDTGNYDMGFRTYDPGLNRFLTRDMYEGAFADTRMTTDPYTGNRYAFAAGNPLSNIELDGHDMVSDLVDNLLAPPPPPPSPDAPPLPLASSSGTVSAAPAQAAQQSQPAPANNNLLNDVGSWLNNNKAQIAGITTGIAVGVACGLGAAALGVATGGAGFAAVVTCGAVAGAASSVVEHAISGTGDQSVTGYLETAGIGAVAGAIAAPLGAVAGRIAVGASKLASTLGDTAGGAGPAAEGAVGNARIPFGPVNEKTWNVFDRAMEKGSPFPGWKGGGTFANDGRFGGQKLPGTTSGGDPITYTEWDVNPYIKGVDRGEERIVIGDGAAYYTSDHYKTFLQFWGPGW